MPWYMAKIVQWLWFFRRNPDYRTYCKAKRAGRSDICEQLEATFPRLAELYVDWGDIHVIDLFGDEAARHEWWRTRAKLFMDIPMVDWIEDPNGYEHRPGHLLIDVPLMDTKAATMRVVEKFLTLEFKHRAHALAESTKPAVRLSRQPRRGPKYVLHPDGANVNAATKRAIAKAIYVDRFRRDKGPDGKSLSITDTVLAIKQDPGNPLGWSMTTADEDSLRRGTFAKSILDGSEVSLVKRHRRDFDAYVRNTIHGRFPDNS